MNRPNRIVAGLDVHKDSVFLCILDDSGKVFEQKYGVLTPDLDSMASDMQKYGVTELAMESTSIYWMPIWRILEEMFDQKLVNPYFIKQLPGRKTDVKDAEWIATCVHKELIRGSYVPESIIQELRQYDRKLFDLNRDISGKLVRLDSCLQRCNIRISNYISTVDSKSYRNVASLLSQGITLPEKLLEKIHGRTINKYGKDTLTAALTGVVSKTDSDIISMLLEEIEMLQKHKTRCQERMTEICQEKYPEQMKRLKEIPGLKERSATAIIAEVGVDMKMFATAASLVSWCGLRPRNEESAGKIKGRKITHGNKYLRSTIIECAWAASRTHNSFFNRFSYTQVTVRRKNRMKILVAIARKILVAIWNMFSKDEDYIEPCISASKTA
ncbi:MAG: IS110 family transposase [Oscillospiraceae bacterium]|nr:IS110 family transposase [Oscillospiraceae bacterium]